MVVFDTNMLISLVAADTSDDDRARLNSLIRALGAAKSYVGIPAPVLAEFLVDAKQATSEVFATLRRKSSIRILPFDEKAAVEAALIARVARNAGPRKSAKTRQQIKVDRQIVAIAKACGAEHIYSDDKDLRAEARTYGLQASALADIPLPAEARQGQLNLAQTSPASEAEEPARPAVDNSPTGAKE